MRTALPIGLTAALLAINVGCSTHQGHVMSDVASMASEPHRTWSRPVELGYEVIGDVQGDATSRSILGIRIGAETAGINILGAITGEQQIDPIVQSASYNAVVSAGADAISARLQAQLMETVRLRVNVEVGPPGSVPRTELGKAKRVFEQTSDDDPMG